MAGNIIPFPNRATRRWIAREHLTLHALVVEDNPAMSEAMTDTLRRGAAYYRMRIAVHQALNFAEALRYMALYPIDLIVQDLGGVNWDLSVVDDRDTIAGILAIRALTCYGAALGCALRIVAWSRRDDRDDVGPALDAGATGYATKAETEAMADAELFAFMFPDEVGSPAWAPLGRRAQIAWNAYRHGAAAPHEPAVRRPRHEAPVVVVPAVEQVLTTPPTDLRRVRAAFRAVAPRFAEWAFRFGDAPQIRMVAVHMEWPNAIYLLIAPAFRPHPPRLQRKLTDIERMVAELRAQGISLQAIGHKTDRDWRTVEATLKRIANLILEPQELSNRVNTQYICSYVTDWASRPAEVGTPTVVRYDLLPPASAGLQRAA